MRESERAAAYRPSNSPRLFVYGENLSRTTTPLANVTLPSPGRRRVSSTNPGTRRLYSAPMSRSADLTSALFASIRVNTTVLR